MVKKLSKIVLFVGRFQPLHKGHMIVINRLSKGYKMVKIGIGSAQYSHTKNNPFTAKERKAMLKQALKASKIKNYRLFLIPDTNNNSKWVAHVKKITKTFSIVYSGNPLVLYLMKQKHITTKKIKLIKPYSSTKIRRLIKNNKNITKLIPKSVVNYIKKIKAIERIKKL